MSMMRRGKTGAKGRAAPLHGRKRKIRKNRDDPAARRDRPCSLARMLHSALRGVPEADSRRRMAGIRRPRRLPADALPGSGRSFPEANEKSRRFQEA